MEVNAREWMLIAALMMLTGTVISNWKEYSTCDEPLHVWMVVEFTVFIVMRLVQFAFLHIRAGPRRTLWTRHGPKALAYLNLVCLYPFALMWCVVGAVWYTRSSPACMEDLPTWSKTTLVAVSFLYLAAVGALIYNAYRLRHHNRARTVSVIEHMQAMLLLNEVNNQASGLTTDDIESIPHRTMEELGEGEEAPTCSICLMDFEPGDEIRDISCGHEFHVACLDEWLPIKDSCPNCNRAIVGGVEADMVGYDPSATPASHLLPAQLSSDAV